MVIVSSSAPWPPVKQDHKSLHTSLFASTKSLRKWEKKKWKWPSNSENKTFTYFCRLTSVKQITFLSVLSQKKSTFLWFWVKKKTETLNFDPIPLRKDWNIFAFLLVDFSGLRYSRVALRRRCVTYGRAQKRKESGSFRSFPPEDDNNSLWVLNSRLAWPKKLESFFSFLLPPWEPPRWETKKQDLKERVSNLSTCLIEFVRYQIIDFYNWFC